MPDTETPENSGAAGLTMDTAIQSILSKDSSEKVSTPESNDDAPASEEETQTEETSDEQVDQLDETEETADEAVTEVDDGVVIKLEDGTQKTLSELKADARALPEARAKMTQGLQEVAKERSELKTLGENFTKTTNQLLQYLANNLPPEPDASLAMTDPGRHYWMSQQRNSKIAELQAIMSVKEEGELATTMLSDAEFKALKSAENEKLISANPSLKDVKRFEAFERDVSSRAKELGFSDEQIQTTTDSRMRQLVWESAQYRKGLSRAAEAKVKVEGARPAANPVKARQNPNSIAALNQGNAMRQFEKSDRTIDAAIRALVGK